MLKVETFVEVSITGMTLAEAQAVWTALNNDGNSDTYTVWSKLDDALKVVKAVK